MTTPNRQVVITCSADTAVVLPGRPAIHGGLHLLLPLRALPGLRSADTAMNGTQLKLKGTQQDFDTNASRS
jgi:hypothetical protein